MKLKRLEIQYMPGIEPGFTVEDMESGVNMVTGPNAVGKSSLIRAIRYLVKPDRDDPPSLSLSAVFENDGDRWAVRRTGTNVSWELNGQAAARPVFPAADQLYCYWLSMEELLSDKADRQLVAELRTAISGGVDLRALHQSYPISLPQRIGAIEGKTLREAEGAERKIQGEYEALRNDEEKIPRLNQEIEKARKAAGEQQLLSRALELLDAQNKVSEIEAGLSVYPENMESLRGDELERLAEIDAEREDLEKDQGIQDSARQTATQKLQDSKLTEGRPERVEIVTNSDLLEQARLLDSQREQKQSELHEAETTEGAALNDLGGAGELPKLDPESIGKTESLAREIQAGQIKLDQLASEAEAVGPVGSDANDAEQYLLAAGALREWLAGSGTRTVIPSLGLIIAGIGILFTIIAAAALQSWVVLVGAVMVTAGLVTILLQTKSSISTDGDSSLRRFGQTGLQSPAEWRREAVEVRLGEIEQLHAEALQNRIQAARLHGLDAKRKAAADELGRLQKQKEVLAKDLGFDPSLPVESLDRFIRLVGEYEQARNRKDVAARAIKELNGQISEIADNVTGFLKRWESLAGDENLIALQAGMDDLRRRLEKAEEAAAEIKTADREQQRIAGNLEKNAESEESLFRGVGLEPGERLELSGRVEQFGPWREQQDRLRDARVIKMEKRRSLEDEEELRSLVDSGDRETLENRLYKAGVAADALEELQRQLTETETRINIAGHDRKLELAAAEVDKARGALESKYGQVELAAAAEVLLNGVEEEFRVEHEPAVLRAARDNFALFTHGSYELLLLDEEKGFMALDTSQQARRDLAVLSTATRMQLLLAVRLAWITHMEEGHESLPLFLDEALTTSDEHRFGAVAENIEQLQSDEGRQVFYLCASRYEAGLWERSTGSRPHEIDLAAIRFGGSSKSVVEYELPPEEELRSPDGMDAAAYAAAVHVPPVDPSRPAGSIHVFYLLRDDLALLYILMQQWRIVTLGQLESLLASSVASEAITYGEKRSELAGRCVAARAWVASWRHGRGKPVDRRALEESDAVSQTFIDRVTELSESVGGDAAKLVEALEARGVDRFRAENIQMLQEYLISQGFIDEEEQDSADERERVTIQAAAGKAAPEEARKIVLWLECGMPE